MKLMHRSQHMFPKTKEGLIQKWREGIFSSQKGVAQSHVSERKGIPSDYQHLIYHSHP